MNVGELVAMSLGLFAFAVLLSRALRWLIRKVGSSSRSLPHVLSYGILVLLYGAGTHDAAGTPRFGFAAALLILPQLAAFMIDVWQDSARQPVRDRSTASSPSTPDSRLGWLPGRLRRAARWAVRNPAYAGFAVLGIATMSPIAWRATERLALAVWPPSMTGSWVSLEDPVFSVSFVEQGRDITGRGSIGGVSVTLSGVGTGRSADLVMNDGGSRKLAIATSMPDRDSLRLTLLGLGEDRTQSRAWRLVRREKLEAEVRSLLERERRSRR